MQAIKAAQAAVDKMRVQAQSMAATADGLPIVDEELDRKINELWLRKREEEEAERRSEQEVREAMAWWAHSRAKIEEEITRRQESIRFASKTAILHRSLSLSLSLSRSLARSLSLSLSLSISLLLRF
jgi:hypothetical protein